MRFVWAVAAFVLAALMIGAGIAQRTVFQGPKTETASISVEEDALSNLGAKLGDHITWDIQGAQIETVVTSVRRVDWALTGTL